MSTELRALKRVADRLAKAQQRAKDIEHERDQMIVAVLNAGHTTREIAPLVGVTQARIVQIAGDVRRAHLDVAQGD
jgi:hypothetical protein